MIIKNANIVNEGEVFTGWVAVTNGIISSVGNGECPFSDEDTIDATGKYLLPGVIDTHVHFRDPGFTDKGDMATESRAAVEGGVTSIIDMPNTKPATVSIRAVKEKMETAADRSWANYAFFIGATNDNIDELLSADYSRIAGVKLFMGSSTGNMLVDDVETLERVFRDIQALVAVHAESEQIILRNRDEAVASYGSAEAVPVEEHPRIRSRQACVEATREALQLARRHGTRLHVCHLSTAEEASMFRSGDLEQKRITAETCPHYLWFCDEDYSRLGARIKCNPAIKGSSDRLALLGALHDGRIDTIATDHAPHLPREKEGGALTAMSGMPGIRYSLRIMLELAHRREITLPEVVEKMCHNPAVAFGICGRGFIREGYHADLVLVGIDCPAETITDEGDGDRCGWTPYAGAEIHSRIERVWVNGKDINKGKNSQSLRFKR